MLRLQELFKKILQSNTLQYLFSRYIVYFIQFINSIFIAYALGPYYMGVWGIIQLTVQYLAQFNLGISHSMNVISAINKKNIYKVEKTFNTSLSLTIILSCLVILIFTVNSYQNYIDLGKEYNFNKYALGICTIACLSYINSLFLNIFRIFNKLNEIVISQSLFPVSMGILILFLEGQSLVTALLILNCFTAIISLVIFLIRAPIKVGLKIEFKRSLYIIRKGFWLFIYNASFYLILISIRSYIGLYYTIIEFGYFTFAFTIANAFFLLVESFGFLVYPKLLNRLTQLKYNMESLNKFEDFRKVYMISIHGLMHIIMFLSPIIFYFLDKYIESILSFKLILMTITSLSSAYGYSVLLIADHCEKRLAVISFLSLLLNCSIAFFIINFINVSFEYVIISSMIAHLFYSWLLMNSSNIYNEHNWRSKLDKLFPISIALPYCISLVLIITNNNFFFVSFLIFVLLNFKTFILIKYYAYRMVFDKAFIKV